VIRKLFRLHQFELLFAVISCGIPQQAQIGAVAFRSSAIWG
jgi:hypothetical protein